MTDIPRTSQGRAVTEHDIEGLAREAEAGYDTDKLRRSGGRKPIGSAAARVVLVRLDPELDAALRRRGPPPSRGFALRTSLPGSGEQADDLREGR